MGKVLSGAALWGALEGKKEEAKEIVPVKFGDVDGQVTVRFVDVDEVQEIINFYEDKKPKKPTILIELGDGRSKNISVPNDEEKYEAFNTRKDAVKKIKKWEEKCKPIEREKKFRLAYEFIVPEERPSEDVEEGITILDDRLRFMDVVNIVNKGFSINAINEQMGKQEDDS